MAATIALKSSYRRIKPFPPISLGTLGGFSANLRGAAVTCFSLKNNVFNRMQMSQLTAPKVETRSNVAMSVNAGQVDLCD